MDQDAAAMIPSALPEPGNDDYCMREGLGDRRITGAHLKPDGSRHPQPIKQNQAHIKTKIRTVIN